MKVLVVGYDQRVVDDIRSSLLDRGHDVTVCRGPCGPSYVCAGGRDKYCPFPATSDVVVLDCHLESDGLQLGTPSWHLLLHYRSLGLPVVALAGPDDLPVLGTGNGGLVVLPRTTEADAVAAAVAAAA